MGKFVFFISKQRFLLYIGFILLFSFKRKYQKQNLHFQRWISWLLQRWRTRQNAIINVNRKLSESSSFWTQIALLHLMSKVYLFEGCLIWKILSTFGKEIKLFYFSWFEINTFKLIVQRKFWISFKKPKPRNSCLQDFLFNCEIFLCTKMQKQKSLHRDSPHNHNLKSNKITRWT